jgi:hypothetical protein
MKDVPCDAARETEFELSGPDGPPSHDECPVGGIRVLHQLLFGRVRQGPRSSSSRYVYRMLRICDCLDPVLQIAAEVPQRIARVDPSALSLRPAKAIVAHRITSGSRIRRIIVVAGIAIFFIEVKKVNHPGSPPSARIASYWREDTVNNIGSRGDLLLPLISAA